MDLPFLVSEGFLERHTGTGYLKQLPSPVQVDVGTQLINYYMSPGKASKDLLRQTLQSVEDVKFLTETVGVAFSFPVEIHLSTIERVLKLYSILFCQKTPFGLHELVVVEKFVCGAIRQMVMLFDTCHDATLSGKQRNVVLIGEMLHVASSIIIEHEKVFSKSSWILLMRIWTGILHLISSEENDELCSTVASVFWEVMLRGGKMADDEEHWEFAQKSIPLKAPFVKQWSVATTAVTKAMTRAVSLEQQRSCRVHITWHKWHPSLDSLRKESTVSHLSLNAVQILWIRMSYFFSSRVFLSDIKANVEILGLLACTARNCTCILGATFYWKPSTENTISSRKCSGDKIEDSVPVLVDLSTSANSLLEVWGYILEMAAYFGSGRGSNISLGTGQKGSHMSANVPFRDTSQGVVNNHAMHSHIYALEGMATIYLRRETEFEQDVDNLLRPFWNLCLDISVNNSRSHEERAVLLLIMQELFTINLHAPGVLMREVQTMAIFQLHRCVQMLDMTGHEDRSDSGNTARNTTDKARTFHETLEYLRAAIMVLCNIGIISLERMDIASVYDVVVALESAQKNLVGFPEVFQRVLSSVVVIATHIYFQNKANAGRLASVFNEIVLHVLSILEAPYYTYNHDIVCIVLSFLLDFITFESPLLQRIVMIISELCKTSVMAISTQQTRDNDEVRGSARIYADGCETLIRVLEVIPLVTKDNRDILRCVATVVDCGFQKIVCASALPVREAALKLMLVLDTVLRHEDAHHMSQGKTTKYRALTEEDIALTTTSIRCFTVGYTRIISVVQLDTEQAWRFDKEVFQGSLRDVDIVLIVRDVFGRYSYNFSKKNDQIATRSKKSVKNTETESRSVESLQMNDTNFTLFSTAVMKDPFRFMMKDSKTNAMLEQLKLDQEVDALMRAWTLPESMYECTAFRDCGVDSMTQPVNDHEEGICRSRELCGALGLFSSSSRRLDVTNQNIKGRLKGLDLLVPEEVCYIPVLYARESPGHGELDSMDAFRAFCEALGEPNVASPRGCRLRRRLGRLIRFCPKMCTLEYLEKKRKKKALGCAAQTSATTPTFRIIWDSTIRHYDWTNVSSLTPRILRSCGSFHTTSRDTFDLVIHPLPKVGLYSIRLHMPSSFSSHETLSHCWATPLLHGMCAGADALPSLVVSASFAATHRIMEDVRVCSGSPILHRKLAIERISQLAAAECLPCDVLIDFV